MTTAKLKMSQPASISKDKPKIPPGSVAILILVGILFPLLAIEAITRFFPSMIPLELKSMFQNEQDQPLKGLTPDETLGYKYAPGLANFSVPFEDDEAPNTYPVSTVSLGYTDAGFRDDGLQTEPFAVVIGDSYASCASVEMQACWVELLEKKAGKDLANLGVVGYSPQQEVRMLSKYGLPLQPKLVLWIFFANDLNDAWRFDQLGTGAAKEGKIWQNPINAWLARNSVVYNIGSFFWYNRYLFYNLAKADRATVPRDSNLVWWLTYTNLDIPEVADGFALTQQAMLEARRQSLAQGSQAKFVVIVLPYREQAYAPAAMQPQLDRLNQALADFCRQHQLACLDLTPALREKAQDEADSIYFRKDIHLNIRGNELVAELLAEALKVYW